MLFLLLLSGFSSQGQIVKSISLPEALLMAAKGNRQLQVQALEEMRQKEVTREIGSRLLPDISAGGNYLYYFNRQVIFLPGSFTGTEKPVQDVTVGGKHAFSGLISASQPLLDETARRQKKAALYDERVQQEKTESLESRLGEQISVAYLDMLLLQSQMGLQQQSLSRNEKALDDARRLFLQGRGLKADTLRAFIAVENLRALISYLENNLEVSGIQLKRLIGMDDKEAIALSDSLSIGTADAITYNPVQALETALEQRDDIAMQQLAMDKSNVALAIARAGRLPRIAAVGHYQLQAQADNLRPGHYVWPPTSFLGMQATVPVFSGNRTRAQIRQAAIRVKQEAIGLDDLRQSVKSELASLLMQWKEAGKQLDIHKRTVDLAAVSYSMMDDRYRNGLGTRLELTDTELALTQAKVNYLLAVYRYKVIQVQLRRAQGLLKLQ